MCSVSVKPVPSFFRPGLPALANEHPAADQPPRTHESFVPRAAGRRCAPPVTSAPVGRPGARCTVWIERLVRKGHPPPLHEAASAKGRASAAERPPSAGWARARFKRSGIPAHGGCSATGRGSDAMCKGAVFKDSTCKGATYKGAMCKDAVCKGAMSKDATCKCKDAMSE
ncbi:Pentapeptide MXKDX repeat protein, partial [Diplonema papillatum]